MFYEMDLVDVHYLNLNIKSRNWNPPEKILQSALKVIFLVGKFYSKDNFKHQHSILKLLCRLVKSVEIILISYYYTK